MMRDWIGCRGPAITAAVLVFVACGVQTAGAADWPMWRCDAARSAVSPEKLPKELTEQWVRKYPPLRPAFWQARQERVQFDAGYEPVVLGKTMLVASSRNDSVTALDTETGAERWRFYADGPVRLAPAAWNGRAYFTSDDGCLYCLEIASGKLLWKVRGSPSSRKAIGNGRLISVWPARGGPVVADGRVYFAAGVWPFEGIFVHARDALSGRPVWINDRTGSMYIEHPHAAMAFGGPSPQGYLMVHQGKLVVPSSRAFPAFFDLQTGKLDSFEFGHGGHGSRPGGWFVCSGPDGTLCIDPEINSEIHDAGQQIVGQSGVRRQPNEELQKTVTVGGKPYRLERGIASTIRIDGQDSRCDAIPGIGRVRRVLVADGKKFLVTDEGAIHCLGPGPEPKEPRQYGWNPQPLDRPADAWAGRAEKILQQTERKHGYGLVWGLQSGRLVEELARQSALHLVAVDPNAGKIDALRRRLDAAGLYGPRVAIHAGDPLDFGFPPYLADLIVCEDLGRAGFASGEALLQAALHALRPYGGTLCLEVPRSEDEKIGAWLKQPAWAGVQRKREGELLLLVRSGPPAGAANYAGQVNGDELVRAPLGLLWFGDTFHHHKLFYKGFTHEAGRGLPTTLQASDGVLRYLVRTEPHGPNPTTISYVDYLKRLNQETGYAEARIDVYSGRVLDATEAGPAKPAAAGAANPGAINRTAPGRRNPITGVEEGREFLKAHGCDEYAVDYGNLLTMRSGTAAIYDKRLESGTINISGTRSGCRNSIVPACGVLSLPSWTGNCTCNYPVYTSLALAPMPPEFEQWSAWGGVAIEAPVRRVGINFGAPGDRVAEDGALWLDWPSVGGPSPRVPVQVAPADVRPYYRHALWMQGGAGWPWVFASGIEGVRSIRIETVARRSEPAGKDFSVRWTGTLRPPTTESYTLYGRSDRSLRLWLDDRLLLDNSRSWPKRPGELSATVPLVAGRDYGLRIEYAGARGPKAAVPAGVELCWSSPSIAKQVIPAERLSAGEGQPGGLAGEYFDNAQPVGPAAIQVDPKISFDWTHELPAPIRRCRTPGRPIEQSYTVRLVFAEPDEIRAGQRVFSVRVQGKEFLHRFDVLREAGGVNRGLVRQLRGVRAKEAIELEFEPHSEKPALIAGVELISETVQRPATASQPARASGK